jgi:hypothetical protein
MRIFIFLFFFVQQLLTAQDISILRTFYADDYRDWLFYDAKENELGTLRTRWQMTRDYSQWDIRLGELSGSILLRWQDRPNEWEVRIKDDFCYVVSTWPGQLDSWRISYKDKTYYLNLIPDPEGIQWALEQDQNALCYIYNVYYADPREWEVHREKGQENIDTTLMVTALFLVSYYSTPK